MTRIFSCLRPSLAALLLVLLCGLAGLHAPLHAAVEPTPTHTLDTLRSQLTAVPGVLGEGQDIRDLMAATRSIQGGAEAISQSRKSQLDELDARLAELGAAPEQGSGGEASDLARQRNELQKQRATVDKELKLAGDKRLFADLDQARVYVTGAGLVTDSVKHAYRSGKTMGLINDFRA